QTPNMDRIALEGMRLDNCFCTNSICTPSRASILTGLYSHKNGSIAFNSPDPNCITFPQLLRNDGYFTAMIGKWHLNIEPYGFDRWSVVPGQGQYFDPVFIDQGVRKTIPGYVTDITTDLTIEAIEDRPKDKPFCVLCHHKAPHDPWEHHPRHENLFPDGSIGEPTNLFDDYSGRARAVVQSTQRIGSDSPGHTLYEDETGSIVDADERMRAQYQIYMQRYLRCVAAIDEGVGRLLDYLDQKDLTRDTIVIYTSDQGFFLGEHGWYDKRFMYEESLRMPFVVRYPAAIDAGGTDDHLILNTDFAATLLDFAGIGSPSSMQSESFRTILEGSEPHVWRDSFYYRYYYSHFNTPAHWGVRTDRHKLIYYHASDEWELYDIQADPMEMTNLYDLPEHAALVERLKRRLAELQDEVDDHESGADGDRRAAELMRRPAHPMH
ncbi:MAG: DUF4976 domain-containing protein, partial [Chrysiogenales bacterium]